MANIAAAGGGVPQNMEHPHSEEWFNRYRHEIFDFVGQVRHNVVEAKRNVLVEAPVKSGKREIVECLAASLPDYRVKYLTSLNRKDVKEQQEELEVYSIRTHVLVKDADVEAAVVDVKTTKANGLKVICCIDECDYGSGAAMKMSKLWSEIVDDFDVVKVYFSATAEETAASELANRTDYVSMLFEPPEAYCGAAYFLNAGLVFESEPFFVKNKENDDTLEITAHGIKVIQQSLLARPERHVGVVRTQLPTSLFKDKDKQKVLKAKLKAADPMGKPWDILVADEKTPLAWENRRTRNGIVNDTEVNYLIIIKQTCTRGTDLKGWHHKLAFWHDERQKKKTNFNTIVQAILRPAHYSSCYGGVPQAIHMYVDEDAMMVAAKRMTLREYVNGGGKAPMRTKAVGRPVLVPGGAGEWGVPIKFSVPPELLDSELFQGRELNAAAVAESVRALLSAEDQAMLEGRYLKDCSRRADGSRLPTMERSHVERRGQTPNLNGRLTPDDLVNCTTRYWMDIAHEKVGDIPRGTAYITYGVLAGSAAVEQPVTGVRTTNKSMFSGPPKKA
jgi:hypothetical protein